MRESIVIQQFGQLWQTLNALAQNIKMITVSSSIRDQALEDLLISKGVITKEELENKVRESAKALIEQANASKIIVPEDVPTSEPPTETLPPSMPLAAASTETTVPSEPTTP